jgi:spore photoproduct lyase
MEKVWGSLKSATKNLNGLRDIQTHVLVRASTITEAKNLLENEDIERISLRKKGLNESLILEKEISLSGEPRESLAQIGDGSIIKRFNKTAIPRMSSDIVCPHFLELKWAYGCPFDCSWCYLKGTLRFQESGTSPVPKEVDKVKKHIRAFRKGWRRREILNSGEIGDSLMFEHNGYALSKNILPLFTGQNLHRVLIVTKSNKIRHLIETDFTEEAIVSFSVNSEAVARRWERAPSTTKRIEAAEKLSQMGYITRIRIDPMVPIRGWSSQYNRLIDKIFERLTPERITLGSLRGLQSTINNCPDKSWVRYVEEGSNWGKKVAFEKRRDMYLSMVKHLERDHGYDRIALCKETVEMWDGLGYDYRDITCNCLL